MLRPVCNFVILCFVTLHFKVKWESSLYLCPTCQGYSFTSVSCPPTILVRLLAWPQVQVLVLPLEMVVAGDGVVVDTGKGVVEARYVKRGESVTVIASIFQLTR